jgi:hypothetical protein
MWKMWIKGKTTVMAVFSSFTIVHPVSASAFFPFTEGE